MDDFQLAGSHAEDHADARISSKRVDVHRLKRRTPAMVRADEPSKTLRPLVKCAGGKSWIVAYYSHLLPTLTGSAVMREPFVGGGAVAGYYVGRTAVQINDKNRRLVAVYQAVRDDPERLIAHLDELTYPGDYYQIRERFNATPPEAETIAQAAWYVYLSYTCFNGVYRENKAGRFNVPVGRYKNPNFCDAEKIRAWNAALRRSREILDALEPRASDVTCSDFEPAIARAREKDFVFIDSPYPAASKTANFNHYQAGGFSTADQVRLAGLLPDLDARGARFLLTNAASTADLYSRWHILEVQVPRHVNSKATKRGAVPEILVSNYPLTPTYTESQAT
jgi:DNA adenine methylase